MKYFLRFTLTLFSYCIPRKTNLWIFTSAYGFTENSKYLFLHVSNNYPDIDPVWLAHDKEVVNQLRQNGYMSEYSKSLRGLIFQLRAKVIFKTHNRVTRWNRGAWYHGSIVVFLDHGLPLREMSSYPLSIAEKVEWNNDFIILQGQKKPTEIYDKTNPYWYRNGQKLSLGYPRNDIFYRQIDGSNIMISNNIFEQVRRVSSESYSILYLPTYRHEYYENPLLDSTKNINIISHFLRESDSHLFIKPHPKMVLNASEGIKKSDNITRLEGQIDPYPLCKYFNCFILDYSSMFIDLLLTGQPIVFFPYDEERYFRNTPPVLDYKKITPGPKAYSINDLIYELKSIHYSDEYANQRNKMKESFHQFDDGNASNRITNFLIDTI